MWLRHDEVKMDLQTYLSNAVQVARQGSFDQSDQLSLGELIAKLEPIAKSNEDAQVVFDFEYLFPTRFSSWRGIYRELALEFKSRSYTEQPMVVSEFLQMCKATIGKTFEGYKGGDFVMGKSTPIWVANYGNSGSTALIGIVDATHEVVLITGYRES